MSRDSDRWRWPRHRPCSPLGWTARLGVCGSGPACPRSTHRPGSPCSSARSSNCLFRVLASTEQLLVPSVAFGLEVFVGYEPQGCRVNAIGKTAFFCRPVAEDMAEMTTTVGRSNLGTDHVVAQVHCLRDIGLLQGDGKARPATTAVELLGRGEQWLPRHDVDVNVGILLVPELVVEGRLCCALLSYCVLHVVELGNRFRFLFTVGFRLYHHRFGPPSSVTVEYGRYGEPCSFPWSRDVPHLILSYTN